jgi:two-component system cell cycle sensor histidine kinase/response regulator CckA
MPIFVIVALLLVIGTLVALLRRAAVQRRELSQVNRQLVAEAQRVRDSHERNLLAFSNNPCPMWVYDCDTLRFLDVNDAALLTYGYSREEFLQMTLRDIRPPEEIAAFDKAIIHKSGLKDAGVWRHRRKNGRVIFADIKAFGYTQDGQERELVVTRDVTKRIDAEEALRQSRASLQSLVDNAPLGICRATIEGDRCEALNLTLREILGGYSLEEGLQLKLSKQVFANPADQGQMVEILRRNLTIRGYETTFLRRDGSKVPVRISGVLVRDAQRKGHFEGYVEDMTQQSTLEQQFRQVQKLEAVGRLAGGIAHDFNNILLVIKLSTEMMLAQVTPENPLSKPLLQVSNASDRATALTRQMLAFGRQQIMQARIINLNAIVLETSQMLRRIIGEDIQLVTQLSDSVENSRLDPDQVTQVILNLAVNARDAMPEGGTLHLETATVDLDDAYTKTHPPVQPGRYVMLAVSDTGTGIDKSIMPHIFDPFFTTKEVGKGTGLGLSIVYGIVKQIGGYIWVYSEPGHGTTFKLYFPATTEPLESPAPRSDTSAEPSGQTILLVEDEAIARSNIRLCLEQLGYRVLEAQNGQDALQSCAEHPGAINLVLTDLVMPDMGGHELSTQMSLLHPDISVVFMSGYTEDSAARRQILIEGGAFLQKPFSVADLSNTVRSVLAAQALKR